MCFDLPLTNLPIIRCIVPLTMKRPKYFTCITRINIMQFAK
jgi:hypothetical protein